MQLYIEPGRESWAQLIQRPTESAGQVAHSVEVILSKVKRMGDQALSELTYQLDGVQLDRWQVTDEEIQSAENTLPNKLKEAILLAKDNITRFHQHQTQVHTPIETIPGVTCWQKAVPIEKVGIYIPGGTAPLFSTVLMLAIPAKLAGCEQIILCSPPNKKGDLHPAILYVAKLCGVHKIFKLGGAQAIGAMAYGTESIPAVYKIFGPGNSYVTQAKIKVQQEGVAIDMPAGPSEVLVLADSSADPAFIAIDLLSQAEHGSDSQVIFVTNDKTLIAQVEMEINRLLNLLPRKSFATKALEHSRAILLSQLSDQIDFINSYAPEHLILNHLQADDIAGTIKNAGSVFLGPYTPESAGDYASGTNHTLPTSGYAKSYSGVNLDSFQKKISFQKISASGIQKLGPAVEIMAEAEELLAHQWAISKRLEKLLI
jgi:histidinol dehydrogenase